MCTAIPKTPEITVSDKNLIELAADIVSAHVSNNSVATGDVPALIQSVYNALTRAVQPAEPEAERQAPAVPVRLSVKQDHIVCLEDGKKLKMLKRYLRTNYDMSPEDYRAKWKLPPHYPMVAPAYAATRQELAKKIGLGRKKVVETVEAVEQAVAKPVKKAAKSVADGLVAAREHLGTAETKPARKPRVKTAGPVEA
jgi:predicted transcriptional regulator